MREAVVVFARQPVPGRVKTRLADGLGAEGAAAVYGALLEHTKEIVSRSELPVSISLAEAADAGWTSHLGLEFEIQSGGDLGERMADCFARRFAEGFKRVVLIGSDTPFLASSHLPAAMRVLADHRVVLGPAEDGGYWLVGQRAPGVDLFAGVTWSCPTTMEATRQRLRKVGVSWGELEILADIDTVDDLARALEDPRVPRDLRNRLTAYRRSSSIKP